MPVRIIKILQTSGKHSRVVTIPAEWLEHHERELGHKLTHLELELGEELVIRPVDDNHNS